jgi:hypothetical protein
LLIPADAGFKAAFPLPPASMMAHP